MTITKPGKYKLTQAWSCRGMWARQQFCEGDVIEITQIDNNHHKVIGTQLEDWTFWDIPAVPIEDINNQKGETNGRNNIERV